MCWSGREKRWEREAAWVEEGDRARRFVGRWERGSAEVGIDSGPVPDILVVLLAMERGVVCDETG